jgi:hypothetical protein
MWLLQLNDMRASQIEIMAPVARADSRASIMALLTREGTAPYRDGPWRKEFRQGGPLEWFNPPSGEYGCIFFEVLPLDAWLEEEYMSYLASFPVVCIFEVLPLDAWLGRKKEEYMSYLASFPVIR